MSMDEVIKQKIKAELKPEQLEIINESHKHFGHMGDNGSGETHYKLIVVSLRFEGLNRITRQKIVHEILHNEMKSNIHALSMNLKAPSEVNKH